MRMSEGERMKNMQKNMERNRQSGVGEEGKTEGEKNRHLHLNHADPSGSEFFFPFLQL